MTAEAAVKIAAALEALALVVREAVTANPDERRKAAVVAAEKGIPRTTLNELCRTKQVTAVKQGRTWLVRPSDVDGFLAKKESKARIVLHRAS